MSFNTVLKVIGFLYCQSTLFKNRYHFLKLNFSINFEFYQMKKYTMLSLGLYFYHKRLLQNIF